MWFIVEADTDIEDLTLCCLCHNLMKNPVWLPCADAFCQACLAGNDRCPICEQALEESADAVAKFEDSFISRLVKLRRASCELCKVLPTENSVVPRAEYHCMDCDQHFCAACRCRHLACFVTKKHVLIPLLTKPSDEELEETQRCSLHRQETASSFCNQCACYVCVLCPDRDDHKNHAVEGIEEMLQNSRRDIENILLHLKETTLRTTATLDGQKAATIKELTSETERIKKRMRRKMDEVIREMRQKVETENIKADSWLKDQSEEVCHRFDEWKSSSPSLRARRRWTALAKELVAEGSIKEQLEHFKPLGKTLARLQEDVSDLPTLSCDKVLVFKPSENLEQLTVGTIEEANLADVSSDCGILLSLNSIRITLGFRLTIPRVLELGLGSWIGLNRDLIITDPGKHEVYK